MAGQNVYQNLGVKKLSDVEISGVSLYQITNAMVVGNGYDSKPVLNMNFFEANSMSGFSYGLIGQENIDLFMNEMGVQQADGLEKKLVFGYRSHTSSVIQGISPCVVDTEFRNTYKTTPKTTDKDSKKPAAAA